MLGMASCSVINPDNGKLIAEESDPIVLTKAESELTTRSNDLGFNIFAEIEKAESLKDRFISPLSLSLALALTSQGAAGNTREEMLSVLGFDGYSASEMGAYFRKMTEGLEKADKTVSLSIANAIWASRMIKVKDSFISDAQKYFDSEVNVDDFSKSSTLSDINAWCSKNTNGKITSILDKLDPALMMVLLNALYFKGNWSDEFPEATAGKFTAIDGSSEKSKLMRRTGDYRYAEDKTFQAVELPYGNGSFVMDVLLPVDSKDFAKAAASLDNAYWTALNAQMRSCEVALTLPVFKTEYNVELSDALKALGMKDAFTGNADFSAMSQTPLCIDFVKQKTYVDVNEKGTEAAAITAIGMKLTSVGPSEMKVFKADRPFIYMIREVSTGAILFMGQKMK